MNYLHRNLFGMNFECFFVHLFINQCASLNDLHRNLFKCVHKFENEQNEFLCKLFANCYFFTMQQLLKMIRQYFKEKFVPVIGFQSGNVSILGF